MICTYIISRKRVKYQFAKNSRFSSDFLRIFEETFGAEPGDQSNRRHEKDRVERHPTELRGVDVRRHEQGEHQTRRQCVEDDAREVLYADAPITGAVSDPA